MRLEHGTSVGKPMLKCISADGLTQHVRRRHRTLQSPYRQNSRTACGVSVGESA